MASEEIALVHADEAGSDVAAVNKPMRMKYMAAVGLCLVVFFGVAMTRHAGKAPLVPSDAQKGQFFIGLSDSSHHRFKHVSKECQTALLELEEEEEKDSGASHEHGHDRKCKTGQMTVLLTRKVHGIEANSSKCFPAEECKCENIQKELMENAKSVHDKATVSTSCKVVDKVEVVTPAPADMSEACKAALKVLEEAETSKHKANRQRGHDRKCEADQMLAKVTNTAHGIKHKYSKCFPKEECKCANIEKELNNWAPESAKVKVECE